MSAADSFDRERALFEQALDRPVGEERIRFLRDACGQDAALWKRIDGLLHANEGAEGFLPHQRMGAQGTSIVPVPELPGAVVDRYKLLERIGEGGFGVVYVAEQKEPVRRRVALKIIKLGMDTRQVVARFEAERQALALMDHPNIAKVLDAGATAAGRPYFVMELVRGVPITRYCDENHLTTGQRLRLFTLVCHAIQHAHQKGIIHRDIKPSNILVTLNDGTPVPKVIDFGIAKATQGDLTDKTIYTQFQQFIGTPAYVSPEQADMSSLDIDTRSDIYALGVLLYELLVGATPFDGGQLLQSGLDEMRRTIREKEPQRPSTRLRTMAGEALTSTAQRRGTEAPKLIRALHGDLDWIVMKCLEKDRTRRYETANSLATDVNRHLDNEPVSARPPSNLYRFQKFVRRNKLAFAAGAAVVGALVLGLGLSTWQFIAKSRAYHRAVAAERDQNRLREAALAAQETETTLRKQAQVRERASRRAAYAADMNLAMRAIEGLNNVGRAEEILERHRPSVGEEDLRGWEWRYLWQFCRSDALYPLLKRDTSVHALAVSHDDRWVATVQFGRSSPKRPLLSIVDRRTQEEIPPFFPSDPYAYTVAFSPVRSALAGVWQVGDRPVLRLVDVVSRETLWQTDYAETNQPTPRPIRMAFSADGNLLFVMNQSGVGLWRVEDGAQIARHPIPLDVATTENPFALARNLSAFAVRNGGRLRVFEPLTGREKWSAPAAEETVTALSFSPDGRMLATGPGYVESAIRLWDAETGKERGRLEGHRAWVSELAFLADGRTLLSASADQTIRLWDVQALRPIGVLHGHRAEVWRLALLSDQQTLLSVAYDGQVLVWDLRSAAQRVLFHTIPGAIFNWQFSHDEKSLFTINSEHQVQRWTGPDFQSRHELFPLAASARTSHFSPDGRWLATGTDEGTVILWDLERQKARTSRVTADAPVRVVGFACATNKLLVRVGSEPNAALHELELDTFKLGRSWAGAGSLAFSANRRWATFHAGGADVPSQLLNLCTGEAIACPSAHWSGIDHINGRLVSPDGRFYAVAAEPHLARIWSLPDLKEVATLRGHLMGIHSIEFSPDRRRVVTGSTGREAIKVWDSESHHDLLTVEGSGSGFWITKFSTAGNVLSSTTEHGKLNLWRAPSWAEIEAAERPQAAAR